MVSITALWLPIVVSAALVFLASGLIHMVLNLHKNDYSPLPGEDAVAQAIRDSGAGPGDYAFPRPKDMKEMQSPEMVERYRKGPVGMMTLLPSGPPAMGKSLFQWFVLLLVIGVYTAYLTGRTVPAGSEYFQVFRIAGAVSFLGYAGAVASNSIWAGRRWSTTLRHIVDGFIFAMLTAGAFAGFYPG